MTYQPHTEMPVPRSQNAHNIERSSEASFCTRSHVFVSEVGRFDPFENLENVLSLQGVSVMLRRPGWILGGVSL